MKTLVQTVCNFKMLFILCTGFASGLPLALIGGTLQAWMATEKVDLTVIGLFSLVGMPYALKFLWAPVFDRISFPILGRRRGWMFFFQVCLFASLVALSFCDPKRTPWTVALLATLISFFSASHDIVVDAFRVEILNAQEAGFGSAIHILGYRIAMLTSGALALILSDRLPWQQVYLIMAAFVCIGLAATLLSREPTFTLEKPHTLQDAILLPVKDFFKRSGAMEVFAFLIVYKLDVMLTLAMTTPFMLDLGFTKTEIGAITKGFGMVSSIIGALVAGAFMTRLGLERALWFFGITQAISGLSYMALAYVTTHLPQFKYPVMIFAITTENLFQGMGIAAYSALMIQLCNPRFTATQYALMTSLMAIARYVAGAPSGWLAKNLGWEMYFLFCTLLGIPGLLLLLRYKFWEFPSRDHLTSKT